MIFKDNGGDIKLKVSCSPPHRLLCKHCNTFFIFIHKACVGLAIIMCQETNIQTKKTSQTLEYTRYLSKQRAMSHKTYVASNKNVETTKMCNMKMEGKSAGVYGFMVSILFSSPFFFRSQKTPRCACVTTHAVFVSWWPLAAARFMSLIPGSAPSIHFARCPVLSTKHQTLCL